MRCKCHCFGESGVLEVKFSEKRHLSAIICVGEITVSTIIEYGGSAVNTIAVFNTVVIGVAVTDAAVVELTWPIADPGAIKRAFAIWGAIVVGIDWRTDTAFNAVTAVNGDSRRNITVYEDI